MGVENIYTLPLNGVPYISGSVAFDGEAKDNKLILESNTKIDLHNSQYFQMKKVRIFMIKELLV